MKSPRRCEQPQLCFCHWKIAHSYVLWTIGSYTQWHNATSTPYTEKPCISDYLQTHSCSLPRTSTRGTGKYRWKGMIEIKVHLVQTTDHTYSISCHSDLAMHPETSKEPWETFYHLWNGNSPSGFWTISSFPTNCGRTCWACSSRIFAPAQSRPRFEIGEGQVLHWGNWLLGTCDTTISTGARFLYHGCIAQLWPPSTTNCIYVISGFIQCKLNLNSTLCPNYCLFSAELKRGNPNWLSTWHLQKLTA